MIRRLDGRVAIVTGGSRGIGRAIAEVFAASGAQVVIGYANNRDAAEAVANGISERGGQAVACRADLTVGEDAVSLARVATDAFGKVDILVNNAGITRDGLFIRMKEADWDAVVDANLKSVYRMVQATARQLLRSPYGRVINLSSVVGLTGNVGQANYVAAKAGIVGFTKALAREFAGRKVTVNAIAPGFIETDMTMGLGNEAKDRLLAQIPLGRAGLPGDVAGAAHFLAGDDAAYITGQVLQVDGGMVM